MNAKKLIAAAAMFAVAGSTFAVGSTEFEDNVNFHSTKTRAEVIAEMSAARANGEMSVPEYAEPARNFVSTKTRAEVVAELKQARPEGQLVQTEWFEPSTTLANSHRTREEVRAEAIQALKGSKTNSLYAIGG